MARKKPTKRDTSRRAAKDDKRTVTLKNVWVMEGASVQYADNLILRRQDGVFHLMFFQQQVPAIAGTHEEMAEQLEQMGVIENQCVARLVISEEKIAAVIDALQKAHEINIPAGKGVSKSSGSNGTK
jgi:hypothetical protein